MEIEYFFVLNDDFVVELFFSLTSGRKVSVYSYNMLNAEHVIFQVGHMIQAESHPKK